MVGVDVEDIIWWSFVVESWVLDVLDEEDPPGLDWRVDCRLACPIGLCKDRTLPSGRADTGHELPRAVAQTCTAFREHWGCSEQVCRTTGGLCGATVRCGPSSLIKAVWAALELPVWKQLLSPGNARSQPLGVQTSVCLSATRRLRRRSLQGLCTLRWWVPTWTVRLCWSLQMSEWSAHSFHLFFFFMYNFLHLQKKLVLLLLRVRSLPCLFGICSLVSSTDILPSLTFLFLPSCSIILSTLPPPALCASGSTRMCPHSTLAIALENMGCSRSTRHGSAGYTQAGATWLCPWVPDLEPGPPSFLFLCGPLCASVTVLHLATGQNYW